MDSPRSQVDNWSIATFLREKPTFLPKHKDIEYNIQGTANSEYAIVATIDINYFIFAYRHTDF